MPMATELCPCSGASMRFKWDGKQLKCANWMFAKTLHHQLGPGPIITKYPDSCCFPKGRHKAQLLTYPFRQILSIRVVGRWGFSCTSRHVWLWSHTSMVPYVSKHIFPKVVRPPGTSWIKAMQGVSTGPRELKKHDPYQHHLLLINNRCLGLSFPYYRLTIGCLFGAISIVV